MVTAALLAGLLAAGPSAGPSVTDEDLTTYHAARARAGRDAGAHLRLAFWCESRGLDAERLEHLALAILADPGHAAARGLMGLVSDGGKWRRPEAIADRLQADADATALLAEYRARRSRAPNTADGQWALGMWCEENGLRGEATAHLTAVTRLDPGRDAAWKRLGYKKHDGRWLTPDQIATEKADRAAQAEANKKWRPLLESLKRALGDKAKRAEAERRLVGISDPRAVPSIWKVFGVGGANDQARAVQILGQIDTPFSSRLLAVLAIRAEADETRRRAIETLKQRDPREYVAQWIGLLRDSIRYEVRPVGGPGSPGALFVEGKRFNVQRLYAPPALPSIPLYPGDWVYYDEDGLPVIRRSLGTTGTSRFDPLVRFTAQEYRTGQALGGPARQQILDASRAVDGARLDRAIDDSRARVPRFPDQNRSITIGTTTTNNFDHRLTVPVGELLREYERSARVAQQQLLDDVAAIERYNQDVSRTNDRVVAALSGATGQDFAADRQAWTNWWIDQLGYQKFARAMNPYKPTVVQNVPLAYLPAPVPVMASSTAQGTTSVPSTRASLPMGSCFGAGTPVLTRTGFRPVEEIRVGDQLLTQDTTTGALSYQPVLTLHHNPPAKTLRVTVGGESIVSSTFHRFWRAGKGWAMARDLKPGDVVRTLGGVAEVEAVQPDKEQLVYNLDVAGGRTFFVGRGAALVHDNSVPSLRSEPFDAPPDLARRAD